MYYCSNCGDSGSVSGMYEAENQYYPCEVCKGKMRLAVTYCSEFTSQHLVARMSAKQARLFAQALRPDDHVVSISLQEVN